MSGDRAREVHVGNVGDRFNPRTQTLTPLPEWGMDLGHASAALMSEERTVLLALTTISPVGQLPRTALIN